MAASQHIMLLTSTVIMTNNVHLPLLVEEVEKEPNAVSEWSHVQGLLARNDRRAAVVKMDG